jgi:hypothetical protein
MESYLTRLSHLEKQIADSLKSFSSEEKKGLAVAISVNIAAFSKPPFNEPWIEIIQQTKIPILKIQDIYAIIKLILSHPNSLKIFRNEENFEVWEILEPISKKRTKVITTFPLSFLIGSYIREIRDPNSVLLIKYLNADGNEITIDLSKNTIPDTPVEPIGVFRIRNIMENVRQEVVDEVSYYLGTEQKNQLFYSLKEVHSAYLGEIANLRNNGLFILSALKASLTSFKPKPKQIIYVTKTGTSIENENLRDNPILSIIRKIFRSNSISIVKTIYGRENNQEVLLYTWSQTFSATSLLNTSFGL